MYLAFYKCKLCEKVDFEIVEDKEVDKNNKKYPLKTLFKWHECEDGSVGVEELIGFKHIGSENMKFRKKPVEIEAFQYDGDLKNRNGEYYVPDWAVKAFKDGTLFYQECEFNHTPYELFVKTLEGDMIVNVGDYVIRGVKGEIYPCKADIFTLTYDRVD